MTAAQVSAVTAVVVALLGILGALLRVSYVLGQQAASFTELTRDFSALLVKFEAHVTDDSIVSRRIDKRLARIEVRKAEP